MQDKYIMFIWVQRESLILSFKLTDTSVAWANKLYTFRCVECNGRFAWEGLVGCLPCHCNESELIRWAYKGFGETCFRKDFWVVSSRRYKGDSDS